MANSFLILRVIFADLCPEILQIFFLNPHISGNAWTYWFCKEAEFNLNVALCYSFKRMTVISNKLKLFRAWPQMLYFN